ncbi:efflux RND transporter periplasmic adaptor subunit [Petroclostridium sp. X23]|uniref:HlyD family secretion protein n=1 Tax=Petroclostridium sp. X23 TaxID=3045146 RepID=UPI0024AE1808|nr:efflux RND transporter periplasmic adaptor subunit [Petroclostridium sp. X23]WHH58848.1 efflux RND transporter periplasmic adaptor subunit [Petroclostridium sp. X23]
MKDKIINILNQKKSYRITAIAVAIAVVGILSVFAFRGSFAKETTENADVLKAQGLVEATEVSINTKIPGRIEKLCVKEGQEVKAGEELVRISSDELQAKKEQIIAMLSAAQAAHKAAQEKYNQAQAGLKAAQGVLAQAQAGLEASYKDKDAAQAQKDKADHGARSQDIERARIAYDLAKKTYERVNGLYEKGGISAQKRDEAKAQMDLYEQQLNMAQEGARAEDKAAAAAISQKADAGILASKALLQQAQAGVQSANTVILQAEANVEAQKALMDQANAALAEVDAYLKDTHLCAPIDGTITVINSDEGELVSSGMSIATVSNLDNAWVEVSIKETDIAKIKEGQKVSVTLSAFPEETFQGTVSAINKKPDFAVKRASNNNGEFDIVVFGVKIRLENNRQRLRPGMSAFIDFKG